MKWQRNELLRERVIKFSEQVVFETDIFTKNPLIKGLRDVLAEGEVQYNQLQDIVDVSMDVSGIMICPCAITLQDVEVEFNIEIDEVFSFNKACEFDAIKIKGDQLDLAPLVFENIMQEVPLKVVKKGEIIYPKGKGWEITTEKDFEKSRDEQIDPRLEVFKNFKFDDDKEE